MDDKLKDRLLKIAKQIELLYKAEETYLTLDAAKDHQLAVLMNNAPLLGVSLAKAVSESAKATWAKAQPEYLKFRESLAHAEAEFHKQKHLLELKNSAFQAEYLSYKLEASVISKHGLVE